MFRTSLLLSTAALALAYGAFAADAPKADAKPAPAKAEAAAPQKDYVILKVGGEEVKHSEAVTAWTSLFKGQKAPDFDSFDEKVKQNVLRGLATERLIYQQAVKDGVDKSAEVQQRLEQLKRQVIMQVFIDNKAKTVVSDADLKKAYEAKAAAMKNQEEIHARHILLPVDKEDDAKKLAGELKKGGDFEKAAKDFSKDPGSAAKGGDLGWFTQDARMVPEFLAAAFKLKKGEISDPVKTGFGWHIIKVEDRRKVKVPSFDEMKESLRAEAQEKAMQTYVEGLLKGGDVHYFGPDGKEKELPKELVQPAAAPADAAAAKPVSKE